MCILNFGGRKHRLFSFARFFGNKRTCKTSIVVTATISILFKANTKETTTEVVRPKAAAPLLWWRPNVVTVVAVLNMLCIVAVTAILVFHVDKTGRRTVGRTLCRLDGWSV